MTFKFIQFIQAIIVQSVVKIFESLSDEASIDLFTMVATRDFNGVELLNKVSLTRKQYYLRLSRMIKVGLIRRRSGKLVVTTFGKIVFESKKIIEASVSSQWKLKVLDSIDISDEFPKEERRKLLDNLIEDAHTKEILSKN